MKTNNKQAPAANARLKDVLQNAERYIEELKAMDDKKLSKHIDLFKQQQEIALAQGKTDVYELLCECEWQTIIARVEKLDNEAANTTVKRLRRNQRV